MISRRFPNAALLAYPPLLVAASWIAAFNGEVVSRNTAKTHLANTCRKLGVTSRSAAIAKARELELI